MGRVIITGAGGYIGTTLAKRLAAEGRDLRLVSRSPSAQAGDRAQWIAADLGASGAWEKLLVDAEAVVHLSARTDLRAAEADPTGDERLNLLPVRRLVDAAEARRGPPMPVIFASTVTIVGDRHANPVDEDTPDNPISVYDRHKLACEVLLAEATRRGALAACSLRLSNVYGPGSVSTNANRGILNAMIRRAALGEPITLYGDGNYLRDFIHLDDVVEAFYRALRSGETLKDGKYVIASGDGRSLRKVFEIVVREAARMTGRAVEVRHQPEPADLHPIERRNFVGNASLFRARTGWAPHIGLEAGIRAMLETILPDATARKPASAKQLP